MATTDAGPTASGGVASQPKLRNIEALKEWTGASDAAILYDSTVDEFCPDGVFNTIKNKTNVAIIGFTTDGDVVGGFYSVAVPYQGDEFRDPTVFLFSFESHGRCMTPQRFTLRSDARDSAEVYFYEGG